MTSRELPSRLDHQAPLTFARMREDLAKILDLPSEAIAEDEDLIDLGLDSIRAMILVQRWQDQGARFDVSEFIARPTLRHWWQVVARSP
ncbi:MAG: phosphopantetheine-binding protein [Azospirillum sp.]|nr:phosphopantetheine-binding protein [Azospirillum sp.]